MIKKILGSLCLLSGLSATGQYNTLRIPDTLSGTTFNLIVKDTFRNLLPGNQTITAGVNGDFWGPTLFMNQGDTVHMNVRNLTNDTTTMHWHGMHLPAVMDGGPHQVIPPGTLWQPYWKVKNNATTFWYHPHLHEMTEEQMVKGIGGFIIIRDVAEAALALPRKYAIDDFPLALTSRRYDATNQFSYLPGPYGDYMLVNGTMNPQVTLPKQYVRFRILNGEMERGYNLGFSDNRTFYVIGNDGGLLSAPVAVTRVKLMVGERVELMVNFGGDNVGDSLNLMAYNSGQPFGFPGGEPGTTAPFGSLLNNIDFKVLHINIGATTSGAITAVPTTLVSNTYLTAADATLSRRLTVTGGTPGTDFHFDNTPFDLATINKTIDLNTTEKWTIVNNNIFGHSFHIHDVQFKIISRGSGAPAAYESGWKDTHYLEVNDSVTFVAKFDDYADATHPFMYHCHFGPHEDAGMMGQFIVRNPSTVTTLTNPDHDFTIYPNPANNRIFVKYSDASMKAYYVTITDAVGRTILMLPRPQLSTGIDVSAFSKGNYYLRLIEEDTKNSITKKFTVQ